jgi:hypothetical protein
MRVHAAAVLEPLVWSFAAACAAGGGAAILAWRFAGDANRDRRTLAVYRTAILLTLTFAFLLACFPVMSEDVFMHLAVGRRWVATGHFPDPDPWLFSLKNYHRGWSDVWGSHLLAYAIYRAAGYTGLILVKCTVVLAGLAAPVWLGRRIGNCSALGVFAMTLAAWAGSYRFLERASLVSDIAGAWVLALCCSESLRPSRWRWLLPTILAVWVNLHPGVLVGLGFVAATALVQWKQWRAWVPVLGASLVAVCLHPDGPRPLVWAVHGILGGGFAAYRAATYEFMPTFAPLYRDTAQVRGFVALLVAFVVLWLLGVRRRGRQRPLHELSLVCFAAVAWLGLTAVRFLTTAAFAVPVLVVAITPPALRPAGRPRLLAGLAAVVALALCLRVATHGYRPLLGERHVGFGVAPSAAPEAAADFVAALDVPGHLFNEHGWGAYLAWRWDGKPQIFYHGYVLDVPLYVNDYLGVNRSPADFDRVVQKYDLDVFFLEAQPASEHSGPLLYQLLLTRPEWALVYWDDTSAVFLRDRPETHAALSRFAYRWVDPYRPVRLGQGLRTEPERVQAEVARARVHARSARAQSLFEQAARAHP